MKVGEKPKNRDIDFTVLEEKLFNTFTRSDFCYCLMTKACSLKYTTPPWWFRRGSNP